MIRKSEWVYLVMGMVLVLVLVVGIGGSVLGEEGKDLPSREILVAPEYTGVVVSEGEDVSIDLNVVNHGRRDEDIDLDVVSVPEGWKAWIKTYSYGVSGVHVRSDKLKSLTFRAEPGSGVGPGRYIFRIEGRTRDGELRSSSEVSIVVKEKKEKKKARGVNITTSYPVLRGPTDAKFEFSLEVESKLDKDSIFNLSAVGPENWEINFKPAYEEKFISSVRLKGGQSQSVAVEVKPYALERAGRYPVKVKVSSPEAKGEVVLSVVLTGTYKLDAGTASGLLSLEAVRGKEANMSFYVKNSGSAQLRDVRFMSIKPENWKVKFTPEKIEALAPEELKQVEVSIVPADQALVGDYSVGLHIKAGSSTKVDKGLEIRVTVRASAAWGWIGIGIIVLVMIGLVGLFIRLGRR